MDLHLAQNLGYALLAVGYAAASLQGPFPDPALAVAVGSGMVILSQLLRRTPPLNAQARAEELELRLGLSELLRERRRQTGLSEYELAGRLGTTASRVARMEAPDRRVPLDEIFSALLFLGVTRREMAEAFERRPRS